jgi:uncharacterized protein
VTDDTGERPGHPQCPTCDRPVAWADNPARPFCSLTCKLIDLGQWLDERFRVPGPPLSLPDAPETAPDSAARSDASSGRD